MDQAMLRFLAALHAAEQAGASTNIDQLGFRDVETTLSVFNRCKAKFLVIGDATAAWLSPAGMLAIGKLDD